MLGGYLLLLELNYEATIVKDTGHREPRLLFVVFLSLDGS